MRWAFASLLRANVSELRLSNPYSGVVRRPWNPSDSLSRSDVTLVFANSPSGTLSMQVPSRRSVVWRFRTARRGEHGMGRFPNRDAAIALDDSLSHRSHCSTAWSSGPPSAGRCLAYGWSSRSDHRPDATCRPSGGPQADASPRQVRHREQHTPDSCAAGVTLSGGLSTLGVERHFVWQRRLSRGPRHVRLRAVTPADRVT